MGAVRRLVGTMHKLTTHVKISRGKQHIYTLLKRRGAFATVLIGMDILQPRAHCTGYVSVIASIYDQHTKSKLYGKLQQGANFSAFSICQQCESTCATAPLDLVGKPLVSYDSSAATGHPAGQSFRLLWRRLGTSERWRALYKSPWCLTKAA